MRLPLRLLLVPDRFYGLGEVHFGDPRNKSRTLPVQPPRRKLFFGIFQP
jgi:hypothetical protein